ncbi:MAG: UDP-N-acetylglucosamine acyltransferase [Methylophilales bacterium BACL14 MAG-120910-bin43]|jgi:UDP-N-acetylglucosamine acyltransferase|nr:MAG: UDP-N-acetylglucosamine acyltransferase [Methylophilales bacterium BACL14 MAG-120910-bin43]
MSSQDNIHPTAIIHKEANIGNNVTIGPYSVIGAGVSIGQDTVIGNSVTITGNTSIGFNNKIFHSSSIGEAPQDKKYNDEDTKLIIGNNNTIREFCTINRGTAQDKGETIIGDDNWIMAYVHIAHDCIIKNNCILANASNIAGHVEIDDFAILGGFTGVHQFCKIGSHVITAVGTVVYKDIPPYIIAAGNDSHTRPNGINIEGLKRRGFSKEAISGIKKGYKIIYREGNSIEDAISQLHNLSKEVAEVALYIDFISKSQRGLVR